MSLSTLGIAIGLVLIIEGLLPLIAPDRWRQVVAQVAAMKDGQIRFMGLAAVAAGLFLLIL